MAQNWRLAPSLAALRDEVNKRWPDRSKASDGTIGDAAHSEHNPDERGIVRAIDITADGIDPMAIVNAAKGDARVHYVIYNRRIYSRSHGWVSRTYAGSNPHTKHVHVSIRNATSESASAAVRAKAASDTSSWGIAKTNGGGSGSASKPSSKPKLVGTVSVAHLKSARYADPPKSGTPLGKYADEVFTMERALEKADWIKKGLADGHFGTATVGDGSLGYGGTTGFQRKHSNAAKPDGWLGKRELTLLFKLAGMSVKVKD